MWLAVDSSFWILSLSMLQNLSYLCHPQSYLRGLFVTTFIISDVSSNSFAFGSDVSLSCFDFFFFGLLFFLSSFVAHCGLYQVSLVRVYTAPIRVNLLYCPGVFLLPVFFQSSFLRIVIGYVWFTLCSGFP